MPTPSDNTSALNLPLWQPAASRIKGSKLTQLQQRLGMPDSSYSDFHQWTVDQPAAFWNAVWDDAKIIGNKGSDHQRPPRVLIHPTQMPGARFFPDASLNFAENLLRHRGDDIALISRLESGQRQQLSYEALRQQVASLAQALRSMGIEPGDRVAALMPNVAATVVDVAL